MLYKAQQTNNSFKFSNVSTNINNPNSMVQNNSQSYSGNKNFQSTNTTGYQFNNIQRKIDFNPYPSSQASNGPVKATLDPQTDFMQTIQVENSQ